jgi:hypothetical protein
MSERDTSEHEDRVSPYLLRRARTYEEYLRDRETSEQVMERFETASKPSRKAFETGSVLSGSGQRNRRDTADNQA